MVTNIVAQLAGFPADSWPEAVMGCMAMLCTAYIVGKILS